VAGVGDEIGAHPFDPHKFGLVGDEHEREAGPAQPVAIRPPRAERHDVGDADPLHRGAFQKPHLLGRAAGTDALGPPEWLRSYDLVVSNSEYTRLFVQRWWEVDDGLLNPPVTVQPRGDKAPIILSVGRFFDAEGGHSKKQLEMVRAFRSLLDRGLEGWELHLVGGCGPADRVYLERVRHAAAGLPVVLHVDAPGAELRDLYSRASIYWHATGLGEDPVRHPDRFEHFGITTVEAMSAGAVPIVIGHAGQLEVVDHGVNGFHWYTLDELTAHTRRVIDDDALRARLGDAAADKAQHYAMPAFSELVHHFVDEALRVRRAASQRKAEDVAS
jgi:glycosyltransferase involved in cell wall biosynthesis